MKDNFKILIKAILAGFMISIGGTIFLSLDNKIIGALLFSIGLFFIVSRGFNLYTGKVGYIFDNKPKYLIEVLITIIGNFIGTFIIGNALRFTRIYNAINEKAINMSNIKINDSIGSILVLSILCGMLMFLAVDNYKNAKDSIGQNISVFIAVIVFILCSFEHSIANMYYFSVANIWNGKMILYLLLMILGNGIGGLIIPLCNKIIKN